MNQQQIQELEEEWDTDLDEETRNWLTRWETDKLGVVTIDRPTHGTVEVDHICPTDISDGPCVKCEFLN